jgi:small subunit ribosomal protein S16
VASQKEATIFVLELFLTLSGKNREYFYRIIVADSRAPRDGKCIEEIGYFDPMKEPAVVKIDADKAAQWIKNGAQPTDTVKALLKQNGIID